MFKVLTIFYNTLQGKAPQYLREKLKQKHSPRTTRQSTSSGITPNIPLNRKKSFADRGCSYAVANTGMTFQNTSERAKTSKNLNPCSNHIFNLAFPSQ